MFFNLFQVVYFSPIQFFFSLFVQLIILFPLNLYVVLRFSLSGTYTLKHCRFLTRKIPKYMSKFSRSVGRATWIMSTIDVPPAEISY
jgi:hypothetical protein